MTSLVVSIIALCVSVGSLTWQFALFQLNGPRLRAQLTGGSWSPRRMITAPLDEGGAAALGKKMLTLTAQGHGQPILAIRVFNKGRLATQVLRVGAELGNGTGVIPTEPHGAKVPLPCTIAPHEEGMWAVLLFDIQRAVIATRQVQPKADVSVRLFAEVAGGKKVYTESLEVWTD